MSLKNFEALLRETVRLNPKDAVAHYSLGTVLLSQGKKGEAEKELIESIRLKPDFIYSHLFLGPLFMKQKRFKEAEAEWRRVTRLKPALSYGHRELGQAIQFSGGERKEAGKELREAVRLAPDDAEAHFCLGDFLQAKYGRYQIRRKEAAKELQETVRLNPGHYRAFSRLVYLLLPVGKYEEAVRAGREAIRLYPRYDGPIMRWQIGRALTLQGKIEEAEKEFRKSVRKDKELGWARYDLSEALWRQGKHKEAERELLRSPKLNPNNPEFYYNLGRCYAQWGKKKEALKSLKTTLDKWSESLEALLKEQPSPKVNRTQEAVRVATLQRYMLPLQPGLEKDKEWDRLRKDKRFKELSAEAKRLWLKKEQVLKDLMRKRRWVQKKTRQAKDSERKLL